MPQSDCPFCEKKNWVEELGSAAAIKDSYAVTPGHMLVVPKRHVSNIFSLDEEETSDCIKLLANMQVLARSIGMDDPVLGFNIGVNVGAAAGQTVEHTHIHLIPRRLHDSDTDPRGGVRGVIPSRQAY